MSDQKAFANLTRRDCWDRSDTTPDGWGWITNGYAAVALKGVTAPRDQGGRDDASHGKTASMIAGAIAASRGAAREFKTADFLAWLGVDDGKPCVDCNGSGRVKCTDCDGRGRSYETCDNCDHEHECVCEYCKGDGWDKCDHLPGRTPSWIVGLPMDRTLVRQCVEAFPPSETIWLGPGTLATRGGTCLAIFTESAWATVMEFRMQADDVAPSFPNKTAA
jgi:hypothetical protein